MSTPSVFRRLASAAVRGYLRHCPLRAGKWRLLRWASSFLVVELVPGTFIRVSDLSNAVGRGVLGHGLPGPAAVPRVLSLLGPAMTVLDGGANIGESTLPAAGRAGAAGRVHASEPTPATAASLRRNVTLNGLGNVA